jgi:uncharacterized protein YciI
MEARCPRPFYRYRGIDSTAAMGIADMPRIHNEPWRKTGIPRSLAFAEKAQMLYVVLFEDNANLGTDVRRQHMPAHLSFLEKNAARIKAAGPLRAPSGDPAGGLWVVEADSADVVDALVKEDPFWPTGLRRSVRILSWGQVFADGKRMI